MKRKSSQISKTKYLSEVVGLLIIIGIFILAFISSQVTSRFNLAAVGSLPKDCKVLKYTNDLNKSINIVFVPSGFKGDMAKYEGVVKRIYERMKLYSLYSEKISELNVLYTTKESLLPNDFCVNNIPGVAPQFLFCSPISAKKLSSSCVSNNVYTVVVDNTTDNAGAGLWMFDMATVSSNSAANIVAPHELGHAIFGFGDEYTESQNFYSTNAMPNCDVAGCPKWADLINNDRLNSSVRVGGLSGPSVGSSSTRGNIRDSILSDLNGGVRSSGTSPTTMTPPVQTFGCYPKACTGGKYYSAGGSIMGDMYSQFLPSHERIACCVYKKVSGVYPPSLCSKFTLRGMKSLDSVCAENSSKSNLNILDQAQKFKYNDKTKDYEIIPSPAIAK